MARLKVAAHNSIVSSSFDTNNTGHAISESTSPRADDTRQAPQQQQQRPLKLAHVDSMLLPSVQRIPIRAKPHQDNHKFNEKASVRATPRRAAKAAINFSAFRSSPGQGGSDVENALSDWEDSGEEGDGDVFEQAEALGRTEPGIGVGKWNGGPLFEKSIIPPDKNKRAGVDVIDLTQSPERRLPPKATSLSRPESPDLPSILRFSPPGHKSPFKRPLLRPPPPQQRPTTPPASPTKTTLTSPTKTTLISPRKLERTTATRTPPRPSIDAFWNQETVNEWNDEYSPQKPLISPRKLLGSLSPRKIALPDSGSEDSSLENEFDRMRLGSPRKSPSKLPLSPIKKDKAAVAARKTFEREKFTVAEQFLREVDEKIGAGEVSRLAESTGGIQIVWSKKLNSTAGRANWRREAVRTKDGEGGVKTVYRHKAAVELAEKVIDDEHRLLNVLAHEYCHLANFMISNIRDQPHGASFKRWAALVSKEFGNRGIEVTTKHSYEISYKYAWQCSDADLCGMLYQRHSKSIDPGRQACGKCKGRLVQVRPVPRGAGVKGSGLSAGSGLKSGFDVGEAPKECVKTEYQRFVKEHFGKVREDLGPKSPMKDVMREIGARYRSFKELSSKSKESLTAAENVEAEEKSVTKMMPGTELVAEVEVIEIMDSDVEEDGDRSGDSGPAENRDGAVDKVSRVLDFLTIDD